MKVIKILIGLLSLILTQLAIAQAPQTLSYQGMLTDAQGNPVPDGAVELTCRLYQDASGGNPLWAETQQVAVTGGVFSTILGSSALLNLPFDKPYWLGLSVNGDSELEPRTALTASAYSLFAESIADNSVTGKKIKDGAVIGEKIADGQMVRSINSITDDITLVEGSNIDITKNGSQLTISATTGSGGLTEVETNSTLSGKGTSQSPLGLANGSVSTGKLKDDAVTGQKIDDGHVVRSINSITEDVTLAEGSNIDITKDGNKLTISATGGGGLTEVTTNSTLSGKGTSNSPLEIVEPLALTGSSSLGAIRGKHTNGNNGNLGGATYGVYAQNNNGNRGWLGQKDGGVLGISVNGNYGYIGTSTEAVYGINKNGNEGWLGHNDGGVYGQHSNGSFGVVGINGMAFYGESGNGNGVNLASTIYGVTGSHSSGNWGYIGGSNNAGYFAGNVYVNGSLAKSGGSFKIDHPLDASNKYLSHSFVESPDMMNVYNGNVILDSNGAAVVELPHYFEALNRDFRYQLTCIGGFAPVYIAQEIYTNEFRIAGGEHGMKVSWQVTGIRQDKWANENRIVVEEDKAVQERGFYLHPELHGLPVERSVEWGRDP